GVRGSCAWTSDPTYNASSDPESANGRMGKPQRTAALQNLAGCPSPLEPAPAFGVRLSSAALAAVGSDTLKPLANTGTVSLDGQTVRFTRPGLVEEYSVSMDGVRQDFVMLERPAGTGELQVQLSISGAKLEPAPFGAQLVLENSGRKIAYSHLRVTDAAGKDLTGRMEILPLPIRWG